MKQKELSVVLRIILIPFSLLIVFLLYVLAKDVGIRIVDTQPGLACDIVMLLAFIPAFSTVADAWMIFRDIGRDRSFTMKNALRLRRISFYALIDTGLVFIFALVWAFGEHDFGGPLVLCSMFIFIGIAIAVACSVLSHLTRKAAEMQDENDLTI